MLFGWHEVERMTTILEAEFEGRPVDRAEAHRLAQRIAQIYPDMGRSMRLITARMAERRAAVA